jgi:hypothetical protein
MKAWRWPMLLLIVVLLAGAIVVSQSSDDVEDTPVELQAAATVPTAARPGSLGSTWYCAGGTATGTAQGEAEQYLHVANASSVPVHGRLTVYPSEGTTATSTVEVPALSRYDVRVSDLAKAPYASVLAEFDGGEVAVQHELLGPTGRSVSACASGPASTWYFPSATTRSGTKLLLSLFNPFPNDAVVDLAFEAEDGSRTPQAFQGMVVPGGKVTTVDVAETVTLRQELATSVVVRSGRVVAEQVQIVGETEGFPPGLAAMLGAPSAEPAWIFPDGIGADAYQERFVLYNPGDADAEVDVEVLLDDPDTNGVAEPFQVTVPSHHYAVIDVFNDGRVPVGVAHAAVVRTRNDVPVVAQRVIVGQDGSAQRGVGYTLGSPVVAGRWLAPLGTLPGVSGAALIVFNPSPTDSVTFSARAFGSGRYDTIGGLDGATIPPLGRVVIDVGAGGFGIEGLGLEIEADGALTAESRYGFKDGNDLSYLMAIPVDGTVEAPAAVVGALTDQDAVLGGD